MLPPSSLVLISSGGIASSLEVFEPPGLGPQAPIALLVPAMGVEARFYRRLAQPLADRGIRLVTSELRGHGRSDARPGRHLDFGYAAMIEQDLPAAIDAIEARFPDAQRWLLGHSLGGQLSALFCATHPDRVVAFVTVAACSIHWRSYPPRLQLPLLLSTQLAAAIARALGSFPGHRLGFAGHEATGVIRDWARQGRTGRYQPSGTGVDYEAALARCATPGLLLSLQGDEGFAPPSAVAHLASKLPGHCTHHHLEDRALARLRRAHFDWVRVPEVVLDAVTPWLSRYAALSEVS